MTEANDGMRKYWWLVRAATGISHFGNGATSACMMLYMAHILPASMVPIPAFCMLCGMSVGYSISPKLVRRFGALWVVSVSYIILAVDVFSLLASSVVSKPMLLPLLCLILLCNGVLGAVASPAVSVLWSSMCEGFNRRKVFATNAAVNRTGLALGALAGAVLIANNLFLFGFVLDAISFVLAAIVWLMCGRQLHLDARLGVSPGNGQKSGVQEGGVQEASKVPLVKRMFTGIGMVMRQNTWLGVYFMVLVVSAIPAQLAVNAALPNTLVQEYSAQDAAWFSAIPAWVLLAGNLYARWRPSPRHPGLWLVCADIGLYAAYVALGLTQPMWFALTLLCLGRFAGAVGTPHLNAYISLEFSAHEQATVYAISDGSRAFLAPLGALVGSIALNYVSAPVLLAVSGALCVVLALVVLCTPGMSRFAADMTGGERSTV